MSGLMSKTSEAWMELPPVGGALSSARGQGRIDNNNNKAEAEKLLEGHRLLG